MWERSISKAIEFEQERNRSIKKQIRYNIDLFYIQFKADKLEWIKNEMGDMIRGLDDEMESDKFSAKLSTITINLNDFFDAFYAKVPFDMNLFMFIILDVHRTIRRVANDFWNKNSINLNGKEVIDFMSAFHFYESILSFWGIRDNCLKDWEKFLIDVFLAKVFSGNNIILANILYDLRNNYEVKEHRFITKAGDNLSQLVNNIFDNYDRIPDLFIARKLTELCSSIVSVFFINVKNFLRDEEFPIQIYIAVMNNNFLKEIKRLQKKIHKATKSKLPINEIKSMIDENLLIRMIIDIERICFGKVKEFFFVQIKKTFFTQANFLDYKFSSYLKITVKDFIGFVEHLSNPITANDVLYEIFVSIIICHLTLFIQNIKMINPKTHKDFLNKIKKNIGYLTKAAEETKIEKLDSLVFKMDQLRIFISSGSIDNTTIALANMTTFYEDFKDPEIIDNILKAKIYFPSESRKYVSNYFRKGLQGKERKRSTLTAKNMKEAPMNPYVYIFIRKLSRLIRECSCQKKKAKCPERRIREKIRRIQKLQIYRQ